MGQTLNGSRAVTKLYTSVNNTVLTATNQTGATFPTFNVASGSVPTNFDDHTCVLMQVSLDHNRGVIDTTTFCSGGGESIDAGRESIQVAADIIESTGFNVSSPAYLMQTREKLPLIFALDISVVFSGMLLPTNRRVAAEAWNNYRGGWGGRIDFGYIQPTWLVASA